MIAALANYEPRAALGILARLALDVEDVGNPEAALRNPDETQLRKAILTEVRRNIGLQLDDVSTAAIERVSDALDEELDKIAGKTDVDKVLNQLSAAGNLPSDLYTVNIISNVRNLYRDHWLEMSDAILETVRKADKEQHFGSSANKEIPALVSLFSKFYSNKFPLRSFTLLVVGQREGLQFHVHQAWRIYPDTVPLHPDESLLDVFKRFAIAYGHEFEVNGIRSKFELNLELSGDIPFVRQIKIQPLVKTDGRGRKVEEMPTQVTFSIFNAASSDGKHFSSLIVVFNLDKYKEMLKAHGW